MSKDNDKYIYSYTGLQPVLFSLSASICKQQNSIMSLSSPYKANYEISLAKVQVAGKK